METASSGEGDVGISTTGFGVGKAGGSVVDAMTAMISVDLISAG